MVVEKQVANIDELEGVLFKDIKHLLNKKEALENILFTTKVIFLDQDEVVEFINKLIEYGYEDMALDYVENLYEMVGPLDFSKLKNENNIKK